ncbi:hypothetical protein [Actinotalea sp. K2]|uniref:hypothetical protein n=1 Tax=Actinotalea sp. K2 TaxID=2939438 RepID=UPI002017C941|nr:hypothetical protein [Actinotalea sp. K2]MCL3862461.1 hypothetical protein [Actinotalea sp. K2]
MTTDPFGGSRVIEQVRGGMTVVDPAGDTIGTVKEVRLGDPDAATAQGQGSDLLGDEGPPAGARERLLRVGYLRINAKGLFAGDRWAAGDEITDVTDDVVHLSVTKDGLVH